MNLQCALGVSSSFISSQYSKTCLKLPLKRRSKTGFQDPLSLNAGEKYCRMLQDGAFCNTLDLH